MAVGPLHRLASTAAAVLVAATVLVAPVAVPAQPAVVAPPQEIDGQINGKKARFVAQGDDVLIATTEADRLGLSYRDAKSITIGGTPLWLVTLESVGIDDKVRLQAPAGVVPSIAGYFAALRAHPAEAFARSREIQVELGGVQVKAYDLGDSGVLMTPAEADRAGLDYRRGKQQNVGTVVTWVVDAPVRIGTAVPAATTVTVTDPEAFFASLLSGAGKPR